MGLFISKFDTVAEYNAAKDSLVQPHVSHIIEGDDVKYSPQHNYYEDYFTLVACEDGEFRFNSETGNTLQYSIDDGETWTTLGNGVSVTTGDKVLLKGVNQKISDNDGIGTFSSTGDFTVEGNAMSLHFGDNFIGQASLSGKDYAFYLLFSDCTGMTSAENLSLPATTLSTGCYAGMFYNCTNLTTPPQLPATTLEDCCYIGMFRGCESLTTAPSLPATELATSAYTYMLAACTSLTTAPQLPSTTLANGCYNQMFKSCTSLTTAPELPATTLANECYYGMFISCTSLTTPPVLSATTLAGSCYTYMFAGCTSLTTAPSLPATTMEEACYNSMFSGCTSLTAGPSILLATTLAYACYAGMFQYCSNLTTPPELPATTLTDGCYYGMFWNCTSLTTAPVLSATTLVTSCYESMFKNCSSLNNITCFATNISADSCTSTWVYGVANSGTFVKAENMTGWTTGVNGIPNGWGVEEPHEYVDLGLPSGTKWATMNIGANSVTDAGLYFQWADTQGYTASQVGTGSNQKPFNWADYKYWTADDGSGSSGFTKYNTTDNKKIADASDDAATVNWGSSWHMPTYNQIQELADYCYQQVINNYNNSGINVSKIYNKTDSTKFVIFPLVGWAHDGYINNVGDFGYCWSAHNYVAPDAIDFFCGNGGYYWNINGRRVGMNVRPVRDA